MKEDILSKIVELVDLTGRRIVINLTPEEEQKIYNYLELEQYNEVELRIIRNMYVMLISHEIGDAVKIDDIKDVNLWNSWLTVLTSMIDDEIVRKGGRV